MDDIRIEDTAGKITIKCEVAVPCEWISDLLSTAFETGSSWIDGKVEAVRPTGDYMFPEDELAWENRVLKIRADGKTHTLTRTRYLRGLEKFCNTRNETLDNVYDMHGAGTADLILQYALFGEEVYS